MEKTFDFKQVPFEWTLCYLSECNRKDECMRYQVCQHAPISLTKNPCVLPTALTHRECPHFMPIRIVHAAYGLTHIYDDVKAKHQTKMRARVSAYLGGGGSYYRYRNGILPLMPEQQEWIRRLFHRYGYSEDVEFEQYKDIYRFY